MASSETGMLFLPPQAPLPLKRDATVVVGRSRTCDLRLPTGDASRRHAEIVPVTGGFVVRDLGSTNGTFVNGEPVGERQLRPGDRIRIGSNIIIFCQVDASLDAGITAGEDKTVLFEQPVADETFAGDLAEIPPYAVLQILELGSKTGLLEVDAELGVGHLWLASGTPVHAETKNQSGFDAAISIANSSSGRFAFAPGRESPEVTITASVTQLLLEASRVLDEG
jgi:pSer/pThr/pTyr-binding forkhead associated (FHA) protein